MKRGRCTEGWCRKKKGMKEVKEQGGREIGLNERGVK